MCHISRYSHIQANVHINTPKDLKLLLATLVFLSFNFPTGKRIIVIVTLLHHNHHHDTHTQSCPTLCDPMDCSLPGSSVHGVFQERILEWVAISSPRGTSPPRDQTGIS